MNRRKTVQSDEASLEIISIQIQVIKKMRRTTYATYLHEETKPMRTCGIDLQRPHSIGVRSLQRSRSWLLLHTEDQTNGDKKMLELEPFAYACVDRCAWLPAQKTPQTTRTRMRRSLGSRSVSLSPPLSLAHLLGSSVKRVGSNYFHPSG
jgi:hypothetical protein